MIIKLNAELDSIESAELAARMIKQKTDGIVSIKIRSKSSRSPSDEDLDVILPVFPYTLGTGVNNYTSYTPSNTFFGGIVDFSGNESDYDRREISRTAVIDVICEKEAENTVVQVFTSLGGLKINKN